MYVSLGVYGYVHLLRFHVCVFMCTGAMKCGRSIPTSETSVPLVLWPIMSFELASSMMTVLQHHRKT